MTAFAAVEAGAVSTTAAAFGFSTAGSGEIESDLLAIHILTVQLIFSFLSFIMAGEINVSEALWHPFLVNC